MTGMSDLSDASAARRRTARGLPDLAALYEEIDKGSGLPSPPGERADTTDSDARAKPRRAVNLAALDQLAEQQPPPAVARDRPPPEHASSESPVLSSEDKPAPEGLHIPPQLQNYISPELWRKLNAAEPPRGVLINALERVRSVLYQLSMFLPPHLVQEKMRRSVAGLVGGQMQRGSLLFCDVSGFTALSERLAALGRQGAEDLTEVINRYFTAMLDIVAQSGGILLKFAGDATLVYFPAQANDAQAQWAVRAGMRMLQAMPAFARIETPTQPVSLQMKIGVATGDFLAASVGSAKRMEYIILGESVARTLAAESAATGPGQLIVDQSSANQLMPEAHVEHARGFRRVTECTKPLDDFEIKAETRRARGAVAWSASPQAILAQIEIALRQIQAITPYLAADLVEQIIAQATTRQKRAPSQFRRTTVLFCNFAGPEKLLALWGEAGVSRVTSLLSAYFNAMHEVIARYGGVVTRIDPYSQGQKMLILFGAPVAHEDDPQRALSTALAMNVELELLNEQWRRRFARHLPPDFNTPLIQHRIGVTYGETYAGQVGSPTRREYTVMGDDVNLSARLMSAAEMGQILLSQSVHEQVCDYFHTAALPPIRVKGKSHPIAIYRLEGPRDDTLVNRVRRRGPLIGREAEFNRAQAVLRRAAEGHGGLLTIQGAAGMGKSHLADVLIQAAISQGMQTLLHQCRSHAAHTPYACWSALLREVTAITRHDFDAEVQRRKLRRLLAELALPNEMEQPLAMLIGLRRQTLSAQATAPSDTTFFELLKTGQARRKHSRLDVLEQISEQETSESGQIWQPISANLSRREREELHRALGAVLGGLVRRAPLLIFFEDAHWMDAASQDFLNEYKPRLNELAMLIVQARRGEVQTAEANVISLEAFSPAETSALVAHLLLSELAPIIHQQSGGNPLYVEEISRWFQRTRHIEADELRHALHASDFLQHMVLSGMESLPKTQQEVARAAAIIGLEFSTTQLQALLPPAVDAVTLSTHLRGLMRARLITLIEPGADARYAFRQAIVRDVLYNSLPFEQRRELHGKLADHLSLPQTQRRQVQMRLAAALDGRLEADPADEAESVARHYELAESWLAAAQRLLQAAGHAKTQGDLARAREAYTRALADLARLSGEAPAAEVTAARLQALIGQGDTALLRQDMLTAVSAYEQARTALPNEAPAEQSLNLAYRLALALPSQRRAGEGEAWLRSALTTLAAQVNPLTAATAEAALAWLLWRKGDSEATEWVRRARTHLLEAAGEGDVVLSTMLTAFTGDWKAACRGYRTLGLSSAAGVAALHLGDQALQQANPATALDFYQQAASAWANAPLLENGLALALYRQAETYWLLQQAPTARERLDEAQTALQVSAPLLQGDGFTAIQAAIKLLQTGKQSAWPPWRWQAFEDSFYIAMILRP